MLSRTAKSNLPTTTNALTMSRRSASTVDAQGLRCPLPLIKAKLHAEGLPPGAVFTLISTDPETPVDLRAWCHDSGHEIIAEYEDAGRFEFDVLTRG